MVPCAEMTRFLKTGAEANNAAVRIARAFTGRDVVLSSGYHGWLDWCAVSKGFRGIPNCLNDSIEKFAFNDEESLLAAAKKHSGSIAAIIVEPANQGYEPSTQFMELMVKTAREEKALLVFDEIKTGFRMAIGGAQEYYGVTPDLTVFAKAISNGYPLAAVCGKRDYMETLNKTLVSSTYAGETASLAAARAALNIIRRDNLPAHFHRLGKIFMEGMKNAATETGIPLKVLGPPPMSGYIFSHDRANDMYHYFMQEMAAKGYLVRACGPSFIMATHKEEEIKAAVETIKDVFRAMTDLLKAGTLTEHLIIDERLKSPLDLY
jgi:glutamate-1-semialdehyde aminotransferase